MLNNILNDTTATISFGQVAICTGVSLVLGLIIAVVYMFHNNFSKNFIVTIVIMPAIVQALIMLVNGNLGTSVAMAGAFTLIRFRSAPGGSRELASIFLAMAVGIAAGTGYVAYAAIFTVAICCTLIILYSVPFGERKSTAKSLKVTIPENLDYTEIFDDIFKKFTNKVQLDTVKTTNLGSLYELQYTIELKDIATEKAFIDQIRVRNGNLNITCGRIPVSKDEL